MSKNIFIMLVIVSSLIVAGSFFVLVKSEEYTIISIADKNVGINETFTIDIECNIAQGCSVRAWELDLSYPSDKLQVISVTEGDIFEGVGDGTFFSKGTVNTWYGKIEKVFNVLLGEGGATNDGSLVVITFRALHGGIASITLNNVGVCNITGYMPVHIDDGTVYIDSSAPMITYVSTATSLPLDTNMGWVNISAGISDDTILNSSRLHITTPSSSSYLSFDEFYYNSSTMFREVGNYSYYILVSDNAGNGNISRTYNFTMPPNYEIVVDGKVNIIDYAEIAKKYRQTGNQGWIREDIDNSGRVNIVDISMATFYHNNTWW